MEKQTFIDLIKKHFGFLMENYGFSIVYSDGPAESFGDLDVILQSDKCKIRIMTDRKQVFLDIGLKTATLKSSKDWYDLGFVTSFLTQGPNQVNLEYSDKWIVDEKTTYEQEMIRLNKILEPYWGQILELFKEENIKKRQKELDDFIQKRAEERFPNLFKNAPPKN